MPGEDGLHGPVSRRVAADVLLNTPMYWPRAVWRSRAFRTLKRLPSPLEARKASLRTEDRDRSVALLAHHRRDVVDEVDLRDHRGDGSVLLDEGHFPLGEDGGQ